MSDKFTADFIDVMVDLETASAEPDAPILAIGAVMFNHETFALYQEFEVAIDPESSFKFSNPSASTLKWWMKQSEEARTRAWNDPNAKHLAVGLMEFSDYIDSLAQIYGHDRLKGVRIWGNGSPFDNVILREAYKVTGHKIPWTHRDDMCYRTLKNLKPDWNMEEALMGYDRIIYGVPHTALYDAKVQAVHLMHLLRAINV